jgi:hypothetical protein
MSFVQSDGFRFRSDYVRTLEAWLQHYSDDRMMPLFFEDTMADPSLTLAAVWRFLGLNPHAAHIDAEDAARKVNAREYLKIDSWLADYLQTEYAPMVRALQSRFGLNPPWPYFR